MNAAHQLPVPSVLSESDWARARMMMVSFIRFPFDEEMEADFAHSRAERDRGVVQPDLHFCHTAFTWIDSDGVERVFVSENEDQARKTCRIEQVRMLTEQKLNRREQGYELGVSVIFRLRVKLNELLLNRRFGTLHHHRARYSCLARGRRERQIRRRYEGLLKELRWARRFYSSGLHAGAKFQFIREYLVSLKDRFIPWMFGTLSDRDVRRKLSAKDQAEEFATHKGLELVLVVQEHRRPTGERRPWHFIQQSKAIEIIAAEFVENGSDVFDIDWLAERAKQKLDHVRDICFERAGKSLRHGERITRVTANIVCREGHVLWTGDDFLAWAQTSRGLRPPPNFDREFKPLHCEVCDRDLGEGQLGIFMRVTITEAWKQELLKVRAARSEGATS